MGLKKYCHLGCQTSIIIFSEKKIKQSLSLILAELVVDAKHDALKANK